MATPETVDASLLKRFSKLPQQKHAGTSSSPPILYFAFREVAPPPMPRTPVLRRWPWTAADELTWGALIRGHYGEVTDLDRAIHYTMSGDVSVADFAIPDEAFSLGLRRRMRLEPRGLVNLVFHPHSRFVLCASPMSAMTPDPLAGCIDGYDVPLQMTESTASYTYCINALLKVLLNGVHGSPPFGRPSLLVVEDREFARQLQAHLGGDGKTKVTCVPPGSAGGGELVDGHSLLEIADEVLQGLQRNISSAPAKLVPHLACALPSCHCIRKVTRFSFCGKCHAPYCSPACQKADWAAGHKKACS